jgi:hypothetical protein
MSRINHILLLLIFLTSHMDSQIITLWLCSFLPTPPQDHEPTISSTISLPIREPISISPTSYRNSPMGPPPFISFSNSALLGACIFFHRGTRFCICTFFPKLFIIYYLLYKHLYLQSVHSLSSPLATCFFWPYATHVTLGLEQYLSLTLADIVHIFRVPSRSVTSTL